MPDLAPSTSIGMKSSRDLASLLKEACRLLAEAMPRLKPDTLLASLCSISWSASIPISLWVANTGCQRKLRCKEASRDAGRWTLLGLKHCASWP